MGWTGFAMMVALLARAFETRKSQGFLHKAGLCCQCCVLGGMVCNGRHSEYVQSTTFCDADHFLHMEERGALAKEAIITEHLYSKAFNGFSPL